MIDLNNGNVNVKIMNKKDPKVKLCVKLTL